MAGSGPLTQVRNRARAAARKAAGEAQRAKSIAAGVSPDRDLEGDVQRCASDADTAAHRARHAAHRCENSTALPPYADREERRDALHDGRRQAAAAELAAEEAKLAADGAKWHADRLEAGDRELAASGAQFGPTYRGWTSRRGRR